MRWRSPRDATTSGKPGASRTAARHPDPRQGQHRHQRRDGNDGRFAGAGRQPRPARRTDRRSAPRGRARSSSARRTCPSGPTSAASSRRLPDGLFLNGWSARGGFTRNPYVLDLGPVRLELGSAVAPAANLCAVAIGTETDGSIICPGRRTTRRRAQADARTGRPGTASSRSPHSQDTAGPMARSVADAAALLSVLADPFGDVRRTSACRPTTTITWMTVR